MDYITSRRSKSLSNEPYEISISDLRDMYHANLADIAETEHVTQTTQRGETYYPNDGHPGTEKEKDGRFAFFKEVLYRDVKTDGFMMSFPYGNIIMQGQHNSYYRGENQIFEYSEPSLYRRLKSFKTEKEKALYQLIADMRIAEFGSFILRFGKTQFWIREGYSTVLFEPLAQHYGLDTSWLDITSDFNVALFFATCYWDNHIGEWKPLTKEQTEINEKTKYGMIFHIPGWAAESKLLLESASWDGALKGEDGNAVDSYSNNAILPIGYQPFMRTSSQHAYGIWMKDTAFPLQDDIQFEKLYFRHNEELSRQIYEKMDRGRKIYPQEGLNRFNDCIKQIKEAKFFSEEAFRYAFEKNVYYNDEGLARDDLYNCRVIGVPVEICGMHPFKVSRQRIRRQNLDDVGFSFEKEFGIQRRYRAVYYPSEATNTSRES